VDRLYGFGWIARRHDIQDRETQFNMAPRVIGSITSSVTAQKMSIGWAPHFKARCLGAMKCIDSSYEDAC